MQVGAPFDRLYAALAFAYIVQQDYVSARNALAQAVRWNPMNCAYRLDLAESSTGPWTMSGNGRRSAIR